MRTTKTISVSLPPAELKTAERLAKTTNRSLSGVVREGLKRLAMDEYWQQVHAVTGPKARALGITEEDVVRLVEEHRRDKRTQTSKKKSK